MTSFGWSWSRGDDSTMVILRSSPLRVRRATSLLRSGDQNRSGGRVRVVGRAVLGELKLRGAFLFQEQVVVLDGDRPRIRSPARFGRPDRIWPLSAEAAGLGRRGSRRLRSFGHRAGFAVERPSLVEGDKADHVAVDGDEIERDLRWVDIPACSFRQTLSKLRVVKGRLTLAGIRVHRDEFAGPVGQVNPVPEATIARVPVRFDGVLEDLVSRIRGETGGTLVIGGRPLRMCERHEQQEPGQDQRIATVHRSSS